MKPGCHVFLACVLLVSTPCARGEEARFWAFQKPTTHALPATRTVDWAQRDLDYFVLAGLEAAGLTPTEDAQPFILLRRVHFDLIGLPPSPAALSEFSRAIAEMGFDAAWQREIDRLLASPRFGERWGRHWLDVARYAESSGKETNVTFPHAWRYRDYVIDAFNADRPYDQFLVEQIAGDLLPFDGNPQRARQLIATGFLAIGPKGLNEMNAFQFLADVADEQIDAVTKSIIACTVACARCHDHNVDPFTMEDYYALAGIFVSTKTLFGTSVAPGNLRGGDLLTLPHVANQQIPNRSVFASRVKQLRTELAALKQEEVDRRAAARKAAESGQDPSEFFSLRDALRIIWRTGAIKGQLKTVDDQGRALALTMGVTDREKPIDAPLLERGEIALAGERVPRGFPRIIQLDRVEPPSSEQSGRLEFARWLTHPDHPLTARVIVNRLWHHLFGVGIVRTVDNFGAGGELPSHPELLDSLAVDLIDNNWSIKSLIRNIVLSRTYRQASTYRANAFLRDPENRLLWRASKRKLEAEAIRDAMLAVSGQLDTARPVGSLVSLIGDRPISLLAFDKRVPADLDGSRHRAIYLPVIRDRLPDALDLFDCAEPSLVTGARDSTNVPLQALYLMNGEFVQQRAAGLAHRIRKERQTQPGQVAFAFKLCFGRTPDAVELRMAIDFLAAPHGLDDEPKENDDRLMQSYCQALLSTAEFRNLD